MDESQFAQWIQEMVFEAQDTHDDSDSEQANVSTFSENGVMSGNEGLVFRMADGSEFQVTIVQSR